MVRGIVVKPTLSFLSHKSLFLVSGHSRARNAKRLLSAERTFLLIFVDKKPPRNPKIDNSLPHSRHIRVSGYIKLSLYVYKNPIQINGLINFTYSMFSFVILGIQSYSCA